MCGGTPSLEDRARELDRQAKGRTVERGPRFLDPATRSDILDCPSPKDLTQIPSNVPLESFGQYTMELAYQNMVGAAPDGTPGVPQGWADVKAGIDAALADCQRKLAAFEQGPEHSRWLGATHDAAVRNLSTSFDTARTISTAA